MSFPERLAAVASLVQGHIDTVLSGHADMPLTEAMRHALQGGKRLRAFLVLESARLHDVGPERALPAAVAIEAMHAYSLVHDDLPAMDDDALRRGQPTVHVKWDEATAILAGDALQSLAFGLLCDPALGAPASRLALIEGLAQAAGAGGMVMGQALDIAAESAAVPLTLEEIVRLQRGKTGALIAWSATAGAIVAGSDPAPLARFADALGLAFQIADDILDVTGDPARTGKRTGKDAEAGKATFVSLLGVDEARARAERLVDEAETALAGYGARADPLIAAARFAVRRDG